MQLPVPQIALGENAVKQETGRPHLLFVVDQFPRALGGGERVLLRLASLLQHRGFRVCILTFAIHPQSELLHIGASAPVYVLPLARTYGFAAVLAAFAFKRFLREQRVDLVQTFFESSDLWAGLIARLAGVPVVWSRRDMGILRSKKHDRAYRMLRWVPEQVFAVSEQVRKHCIEHDHIPGRKVRTVYNGIDMKCHGLGKKPCLHQEPFVIASVGNIRKVKGYDVLLRASAKVVACHPQVMFHIAGEVLEPDHMLELQRLMVELGVQDHVVFLGGIRNLEVHLGGASLFVLPSRSEGFSNAVIEAMAAALPVVATDVGGNAEAVQHETTGVIVPTEDANVLAEAVCRLVSNAALAESMGKAGQRRVQNLFTTDAMLDVATACYRDILARTGA